MGRDQKNENRVDHYTQLIRSMLETEAWRALPSVAQALYPWLRLEWRGPKNNNNGKIRLSVRQAAERMGVSINTAARAFHALQAKGFIVITEMAHLGLSGEAKSPAYELTEIELPLKSERGGRKLYRDWREGRDFPVHKAVANNPKGIRSKEKTHHHLDDGSVANLVTFRKKASSE